MPASIKVASTASDERVAGLDVDFTGFRITMSSAMKRSKRSSDGTWMSTDAVFHELVGQARGDFLASFGDDLAGLASTRS